MATSASTQVPAQAGGAFPPFAAETFASQILWFAIAFVALYLIISRIAIPRIGGTIDARSGRIADDLAEAARLKEQSDAALAAYEKALADARAGAQSMAAETRDRLHAQGEERRKALEAELNAKLAAAETTIAATKTAAMTNVRGIAVDTAGAIVERLTGATPTAPAVEAAVNDALKG